MKIIFTLPSAFTNSNPKAPKVHLAFVEWYTRPHLSPDAASLLYEVKKQREKGSNEVVGQIIYLSDIRHSVQLMPKFGRQNTNLEWKSHTILDECESFYINNMGSHYTYQSVY